MTFLFDIGRVLLDFDFESSLSKLLPPGVQNPGEKLGVLLERKDEFETGKIGADAYIDWALDILESEATPEQFRDSWRGIFTPNEPMWAVARSLAADGHRLILFSNINAIHHPWILSHYPDFQVFSGAIFSHETGFIKPQPEIYHHAIQKYDLDPSRTIYMDDMPANAEAGRKFGFRTWQYDLNDHAAFEVWLKQEMAMLSDA
ncbi:HAD family phosphatase [Luteolibacter pohnpeiensis]|uniref:HAD family phosphatase n=1 Tax=Luteolibacter pohnpeiensis TaxID=454153 RepID=A0A934SAB2_9BACT|nr:HAD family phosphatase [Luteolibacter pohnpeiensis]MBK1881688.1 HAD family phosphatase [Luteolibacter pohnpeiensis]